MKQYQFDRNKVENYTPKIGVIPILKYINPKWVIWCPCDTKDSWYVKLLSKTNKVIYSHIWNNQDFYKYEPKEHYDIIITNPPFKNKFEWLKRIVELKDNDFPFILLYGIQCFNSGKFVKLFQSLKLPQIIMSQKRINYNNHTKGIRFCSFYLCNNIPNLKQIDFMEIE